MFFPKSAKLELPNEERALTGRDTPMQVEPMHFVLRRSILERPEGSSSVLFGMGCFWGAERKFWSLPGVHSTAVGYAGGFTGHPTYEEVCSGQTGHTEVVRVVFFEPEASFESLLRVFWENHDPTQGMRQGNDVGTQYRSGVYVETEAQLETAKHSLERYQRDLSRAGLGCITTELRTNQSFYFAESYHQQYLAKNPNGYCGLGGTGVRCDAVP